MHVPSTALSEWLFLEVQCSIGRRTGRQSLLSRAAIGPRHAGDRTQPESELRGKRCYSYHRSTSNKSVWTQDELELTQWAAEFKSDAPVSYPMALRYAQRRRLEVLVDQTDETGTLQWVIRVLDDPSFWMDAKRTKKAAVELCREMGWKIA